MSRLIAFGCSVTFGTGLDDCLPDKTTRVACKIPSSFAWPTVLANQLGLECVNMGQSGISNKGIWFNIINFKYMPDDIVFVMWTNKDRTCVLEQNRTINIGAWASDPLSKWYYKMMYNEHDHAVDTDLRIAHATTFLTEKNITCINLSLDPIQRHISNHAVFLDIVPLRDFAVPFGLAPDKNHPHKDAHEYYVSEIMKDKRFTKINRSL